MMQQSVLLNDDHGPNISISVPQPYNKIGDGPEGPEVKLMSDGITKVLLHHNLVGIVIHSGKYSRKPPKGYQELLDVLPQKVTEIGTRGKFNWIQLSNGMSIWITYGMSGGIRYQKDKHSHVEFVTSNNDQPSFWYSDARNFGNITCACTQKELENKLATMGHDVMDSEILDDHIYLSKCRRYNRVNICKFIMDQKVISGPGNYFKAEVLYATRINPYLHIENLSDVQLLELYQFMRNLAQKSYQARGASLYTYVGTQNDKGSFQDCLKIYGKKTDPYGNRVITVSDTPDNRTTYFVPELQSIPFLVIRLPDEESVKVEIKRVYKSSFV